MTTTENTENFSKIRNLKLMKYLIFLLYMIQALFYGFYISLPLTYTIIPDYQTLSIFAAAGIPYSLKFLMAPFEQKFYIKQYGKRKTWIVVSLILMAVVSLLLSSVVGKNQYQYETAVLLMLSLFVSALKDVSTDALAVESIQNSSTISTISFAAEQLGKTIALSVFLALISKGYWANFGIHNAIISASTFMKAIAVLIFTAAIVIHLIFNQSKYGKSQESSKEANQSFWEILLHYKHLLNARYQLCRLGIYLLIINHGIMYYSTTFQYEFIKNNLIERQTLMFIGDLCIIPSVIACYYLGRKVDRSNMYTFSQYLYVAKLIICFVAYSLHLEARSGIIFATIMISVSSSLNYYISHCLINEVSKGSLSGINITALLSYYSLGTNTSIQKELIYMFGYDPSMYVGFSIALIIAVSFPYLSRWIENGQQVKLEKVQ